MNQDTKCAWSDCDEPIEYLLVLPNPRFCRYHRKQTEEEEIRENEAELHRLLDYAANPPDELDV